MDRLLQQFDTPVADAEGAQYNVLLYARDRVADTWQAWLVFERMPAAARFETDVETTQPNAEAVLYWATGLTDAYLEGALTRALQPRRSAPPPVVKQPAGFDMRRPRLADVERAILACFARRQAIWMLTQAVFDDMPVPHATVVRALEDLEKHGGLVVRRTVDGSDWIFLTEEGVAAAGVTKITRSDANVRRDPPGAK